MIEFKIWFLCVMAGVILGQIFILGCLWWTDRRDRARLQRFEKPLDRSKLRSIDYISVEPWPKCP